MFWPVPDHVGTYHASKRKGPGCGATKEVVGMVRGPSEKLVMPWIGYALDSVSLDRSRRTTGTSVWSGVIGLLEAEVSPPFC
jgi:hypothetical protein